MQTCLKILSNKKKNTIDYLYNLKLNENSSHQIVEFLKDKNQNNYLNYNFKSPIHIELMNDLKEIRLISLPQILKRVQYFKRLCGEF